MAHCSARRVHQHIHTAHKCGTRRSKPNAQQHAVDTATSHPHVTPAAPATAARTLPLCMHPRPEPLPPGFSGQGGRQQQPELAPPLLYQRRGGGRQQQPRLPLPGRTNGVGRPAAAATAPRPPPVSAARRAGSRSHGCPPLPLLDHLDDLAQPAPDLRHGGAVNGPLPPARLNQAEHRRRLRQRRLHLPWRGQGQALALRHAVDDGPGQGLRQRSDAAGGGGRGGRQAAGAAPGRRGAPGCLGACRPGMRAGGRQPRRAGSSSSSPPGHPRPARAPSR